MKYKKCQNWLVIKMTIVGEQMQFSYSHDSIICMILLGNGETLHVSALQVPADVSVPRKIVNMLYFVSLFSFQVRSNSAVINALRYKPSSYVFKSESYPLLP